MDNDNQLLTNILIGSAAFLTLNAISPTVRKATCLTAKFAYKQQVKLLAGIGVLSIATYISSLDDDIYTVDDI